MTEEDEVFEGEIEPADEEATTMAIDTITRAEIDMQIATAKRYPRSLARVKREMVEMATLDEETAESCFYSLKRKDGNSTKIIPGPSIRLAEIALACYGNIRAGTRSLGYSEDGKFVRELGICHDVEKNVMVAREVKRRITTKAGKRYGDDMIGVTMAAASAIALRNATFAVVPRALVKPAYNRAREVAMGKAKSLVVRRGEVIERLQKLSPTITVEAILGVVDKKDVEEIGWNEIELLIGLGTAIKDGVQTVEEAFPEPEVPVLTPEDVLPNPKAVEKPPEPPAEPAPEILEAEAKLKEKREQLGIPQPGEVMMTEADGKEILAAAKAGGITPIATWKLIHEDHAKADEWGDLPAQYKTVILAKIADMGGTT